jgi:hypothetical protein
VADAPPAPAAARAPTASRWPRRCAAGAAAAVPTGFALMAFALTAGPGLWFPGYVSEAGAMPSGRAYSAGLLVLAGGVLLLAGAFAPLSRGVAGLLLAAAACAAVTGVVPCSAGCPLPPYGRAGVADVVHAGAGIAGMAACAGAMLLLAALPGPLRRVAAHGAALTVPLGVAEGVAMLLVGRGAVAGALERVLLCAVATWLTGVAALRARTS